MYPLTSFLKALALVLSPSNTDGSWPISRSSWAERITCWGAAPPPPPSPPPPPPPPPPLPPPPPPFPPPPPPLRPHLLLSLHFHRCCLHCLLLLHNMDCFVSGLFQRPF